MSVLDIRHEKFPEACMKKEMFLTKQDEVLTAEEVAHYLRIRPLTIYKHASGGKLPGFKVGSHWRFKKSTIDQWMRAREVTNEPLLKT